MTTCSRREASHRPRIGASDAVVLGDLGCAAWRVLSQSQMATRVFLLEDDDDLRESMSELLARGAGAECVGLRSVEDLREQEAEVLRTDLAVLDINLGPGQPSGIDAYHWLKEQRYRGRIVFMTGHATRHPLVEAARQLHGAVVLAKPVSFQRLIALARGEEAA